MAITDFPTVEISRFLIVVIKNLTQNLFSSAFLVDKEKGEEGNVPTHFTLTGAGWGHGVGLCQIGAAVMGERGYYYKDILAHYYPGSRLEKQYE